jgi:hypothetical protein
MAYAVSLSHPSKSRLITSRVIRGVSSAVPAKRWLDNVPASPADKIKIMHGNAERLLKLDQLA